MRKSRAIPFWDRVNKSEDCWTWTGATDSSGYGWLSIWGGQWKAHRVAFRLAYGDFDTSLYVCHRCDNPPCVRPDHLFLGTQKDNMADCARKGRMANVKGERNPKAKLTVEDVIEIRRRVSAGASLREVAAAFGLHHLTVHGIVQRRYWPHVA